MTEKWISRIVVIVAVVVAWYSWSAKQSADREALIATENALATQDTLRLIRIGKDGAQTAAVLALQQAQVTLRSAEARLAKAERLQAKLKADLSVAVRGIDTVYTSRPATVGADSGSLRDSLTITGPPITGSVTADLSPRRPSRWTVNLTPDPVEVRVIVGCRKHLPPEVVVIGPTGSTIVPTGGTLDPALCNPKKGPNRLMGFLVGAVVGAFGWELAR
jgi:hypothetical protein